MEQKLKTDFSFEENSVITFQEGLFGFEEYKEFLPISLEENSDAVLCLQSTAEEDLSFIVMNPFYLKGDYEAELSEQDKKQLKAEKEEDISYYVLCVVKEPFEESTVNLKCPIAVNAVTRCAKQIILENSSYEFRHALKDLTDGEESSC